MRVTLSQETGMNDDLIIKGLNQKDIKAFYTIYDRWFSQLYLFARKITGNEEEALDIATDAYAKVWEQAAHFDSVDHLRGFLYTTTRNSAVSYLRSLKAKRNYAEQMGAMSREEENAIERYSAEAALLERLYAVIQQLPEKQRQVFTLSYLEGKTTAEIAQKLHIAEKTVYAHRDQVVKKLRLFFSRQQLLFVLYLLYQAIKK
ncbi:MULTISPECIES: RNA polymerase sigma factor [Niastella]|uniref:Sigma-70 family RNA polymerase sigma factor n=1 Tax=Niastella soli TaxID=2821487 RepID=A0ABS3Z5H3_9BACT|nr:sigma-70 family RNA polymerase sigma factor [Niastella soli]MBO9204656.1 sigma-70 family RNA polymerase sigma factor [Niastella soli]